MPRSTRALAFAVLAAATACAAQRTERASGAGPSGVRTDGVFADLARHGSPGCAALVTKDGAVVHARGYGEANVELAVPITPATVFDAASIAKQFTAAAVHLLALEGKLSLDDDVRRFVPELPDLGAKVTLRHLLHHTGGLRDYDDLLALAGFRTEDVSTAADALAVLSRQRAPLFAPGTRWRYSNSGFFLLGLVVERASGKSLRVFAEERIFRPLGMASTHFHDHHAEPVPRRATGYAVRPDGALRIATSQWEQVGDGSLLTSVEDLGRWTRNLESPSPAVGGAALVAALRAPGALGSGRAVAYGSGLFLGSYRGLPVESHIGSWAGFRAYLVRFPAQGLSIAVLCNVTTADPIRRSHAVADAWLGDAFREERGAPDGAPPPALARLAGRYRDPVSGRQLEILAEDGRPYLQLGRKVLLVPEGASRFRAEATQVPVTLEVDESPGERRLTLALGDEPPAVFVPLATAGASAADLAAIAGRYRSEELLDATWTVAAKEGKLTVSVGSAGVAELAPAAPGELYGDGLAVRVERDGAGRPAALAVPLGDGAIRLTRAP